MSTPAWPSSLDDVLVSGYSVKEPGLIGWWSNNTLPEYPDNSSETAYFASSFTSTSVVGVNIGSASIVDNALRVTCTSGGNLVNFYKNVINSTLKTVQIKLIIIIQVIKWTKYLLLLKIN